jgi:aryl-alcohol dehydrogenase-like predicted oxidoreductase
MTSVARNAPTCCSHLKQTADFYGPHVTNHIIREALHPYRNDLVIVTKVGALRGGLS